MVVLGTVSLQFQGLFVPISLRPIFRIVATSVIQSGHHVANFFHLGRGFSIRKRAPRIWFRILSIALEKELKVLDYA